VGIIEDKSKNYVTGVNSREEDNGGVEKVLFNHKVHEEGTKDT
jgi:hypothetical protein